MKIALIHDWLVRERGGEKVLEHIARLYPQADIYTLFYRKRNLSPELQKRKIRATFLQWLPGIEKFYPFLLPLFPFLIQSFSLNNYDLVISSSHCVAKGVRVSPGTLHLSFCHTPMRYAWKFQKEYFQGKVYGPLATRILGLIRRWDFATAKRVHFFAANSKEVQSRIRKYYGRKSEVIYPPLDLVPQNLPEKTGDYFLVVSALVPYKRVDLAVDAFNELGLALKIVGTGPCEKELRRRAKSNIEFLNWVDSETLKNYYRDAKALVFPGLEDFGITPLEAQAAGRPVIAYGRGGVKETVISAGNEEGQSPTGIFFAEQTKEALKNAVLEFEKISFDSDKIRQNALRFNGRTFDKRFRAWVEEKIKGCEGAMLPNIPREHSSLGTY